MSMAQGTVKEMKRKVADLQQQIAAKEGMLRSSRKDVKSKMQNLELLSAQINERKGLIDALTKEMRLLNNEIAKLDRDIDENEKRVATARQEYSAALKRAARYGSFQDKLLFVISAKDFNTMFRRYRYTREYMNAHRDVADKLREYIAQLEAKRQKADSVRADKADALQVQNKERDKLSQLEKEQRTLIAELRRETKKVEAELKKQRKQLAKLNEAIDRAIEREIAAKKAKEKTETARTNKNNKVVGAGNRHR